MPKIASKPATGTQDRFQLRVEGMHCAGCAATIERAANSAPGVTAASVSFIDGTATISGENINIDHVVEAIQAKGFDASPTVAKTTPREMLTDIELRQREKERRWRYRAIVGLGLWVPLEILHWSGGDGPWMMWTMFIGSAIVIAVAGGGFYASAWKAALKRTTNMDTLISLGSTTAFVYSTIVFFGGLEQQAYFAEAAGLLGIVSLGHWFEARSSARAGSAVRELLKLQPEEAELIAENGDTRTVPTHDVRPQDRILIRPGARVPVDGVVVEGDSEVDQAIVTGESIPVRKQPGDTVVAGSVNTTGRLVIEATVDGHETTIARIADMVRTAQSGKADIQRLADRVSAVFVPVVLSIAVVTFLGWWLIGDQIGIGVIAATTVLIISCPCALGLATPMAVMVGAGEASKRGILIKSASALEQAAGVKRVIFDKTGTLTAGKPRVVSIAVSSELHNEDDMLALAAAAEAPSEHPVGRAIVALARERNLSVSAVHEFEAVPGLGVRGRVDDRLIEVMRDDETSCSVSVDGVRIGTIEIMDQPRDDAREALTRLRGLGLEITMLTGDRLAVATELGETLGLRTSEIEADATPESKASYVREHGQGTVMVGDGINDAAALAEAEVGVALASGTTIAIESADVVIPGERVGAIPEFIDLARQTMRTIRQNLFFAFFYNSLAIPLAAFGLLGDYGPLWAALGMGFSDITVIGNAVRLRSKLRRTRSKVEASRSE